ncbi:RING-H2 finger protein ATL3 [Apostasia shenzhenica]|uniref:RING-type E3 ubiquitin transferase n=1 Tax=Apostasia shenzhenica TaxID=1088818 RepID=A0A2I0B055_9ASPA|nr:RING-H2 finger protein ATL3 [Apostasia shenzhenica]
MGNSDGFSGDGFESDDSKTVVKISSEVMVAVVIFSFLMVVFLFFVYLYAKNYWGSSATARRRAQFIFPAAGDSAASRRGLDAAALSSLPITVYRASDFKDGVECSVCLCELSDGEKARLLPKCNHGFHLECIDMWFQSHSTCPLCRIPVSGEPQPPAAATGDGRQASESSALPTNVLFWGNQDHVDSARPERTLVISIPNQAAEGWLPSPMSPLPPNRFPAEGGISPTSSKMKSLRRLLSRGRKSGGSVCSSPIGGDIEQGLGGSAAANGEGSSLVPKTPK